MCFLELTRRAAISRSPALALVWSVAYLMAGPASCALSQESEVRRSPWPRPASAAERLPPTAERSVVPAADNVVNRASVPSKVVRASNEQFENGLSRVQPSLTGATGQDLPRAPELIEPGLPVAGPDDVLSLEDLESIALQNNPTLAQATARVQAAQGRWLQGGLGPNPIVGYQGSEIGNDARSGQQGAFVSQEFVRGGKLALNQAIGSQEIAQFRQDLEAQRLRILNDVRIEYFDVLIAQRALALNRELTGIAQRGLTVTEQQFKGEQVSNAEVLQARIELTSATVALRNAENRYAAAWRRLSSVIGAPGIAPRNLAGDLTAQMPNLQWDEVFTRLMSQSPELASARASVGRARAVLERSQAEPIPNVDVQLGLQYDNASQYTIGNAQIGVPIPFANRNQGNIQSAYADLRHAQADVGRIELNLRNRLASAFESYSNARNHVEAFTKKILPDSRSSLDLVNLQFQQGQVNFLAVLTAQRTFFQANATYLQALQELNANRIAIEGLMLTGSLGADSIDRPIGTETMVPVFGPGRPPVERN